MKRTTFLIIGIFMLFSCNSKLDYTKENLSKDSDLMFIGQNSEYLSGYHDYDNNIIGFDLKLLVSNEDYFKMILEKANVDNWKVIHSDSSALMLYKIIDNTPITIRFSKANKFVSVKVE